MFFTFLAYLAIGVPIAVLPGYVHLHLGYGSVVAGLSISMQYVGTFVSRPYAGQLADSIGSKRTVINGLYAFVGSGLLLGAAALTARWPALSLAILLLSRLALGVGESFVSTSSIAWAIGKVGAEHTARVISWNGIATYGALALGAPLGVALEQWFGFVAIAGSILVIGLLGLAAATLQQATAVVPGERMSFRRVFWRVTPHGLGLALGSIGFGSIASFITLYYLSRGWRNPALSLTCFGFCFIGARLLFASRIGRHGGFRVAIVSLLVEALGLALLSSAGLPVLALLGAALTGFGFALVFPALGVEAVGIIPPASRGGALGAYSLFLDVALGISGPLAGFIVEGFGYAQVFMFAAGAALLGAVLCTALALRSRPPGYLREPSRPAG